MQIKKVEERILKIIDQMEGDNMYSACLAGVMKEFGENHGVIYVDKPEYVFKGVIKLIENGTLKEHGSKARGFVENYGWDNVVADFVEVLEEVIHR